MFISTAYLLQCIPDQDLKLSIELLNARLLYDKEKIQQLNSILRIDYKLRGN